MSSVAGFRDHGVGDEQVRSAADQDLTGLSSLLEALADHERLARDERVPGTRITCHDLARVDADPHLQPCVTVEPAYHRRDPLAQLNRGADCAESVVLPYHRYAEHRHHLVPDELLHGTAVPLDYLGGKVEEPRHHASQRLGIKPACERRRGDDIAEDHRHRLAGRRRHLGGRRSAARSRRGRRRRNRRERRTRPARRPVKSRILKQHRLLELLQREPRIAPELLPQTCARVGHHRERISLSPTPMQGEHEQTSQPLAQRVLAHQPLELGDQLGVAANREIGVEAQLERDQPQLFQPGDRVRRKRLVAEVRQRLSPPERERLPQGIAGFSRVPLLEQPPSLREEPLEPLEIKRTGLQLQYVSGRLGHEHAVPESLAEL